MESRITIFVGNFGSGKTEVALNYAQVRSKTNKVALIDLDIVNSYFRSREVRQSISSDQLLLVAPENNMAFADLPIVTAQVKGLISNDSYSLVFDVGGDSLGATALGSVAPYIIKETYEMCVVVNPYRPYTETVSLMKKMIEEVQNASRLKINSIVSNPNLGCETTVEDVQRGHKLVECLAMDLALPIKFLTIANHLQQDIFSESAFNEDVFPLQLYMRPPWSTETFE